jgi:virulence-associated protein VagC
MKQQTYLRKRLHKHGGSRALDLPTSFVKKLTSDYVKIVEKEGVLIIQPESELDRLEDDPRFEGFIHLLYEDALENPSKLKDVKEIWSSEWDELLKGVTDDEE